MKQRKLDKINAPKAQLCAGCWFFNKRSQCPQFDDGSLVCILTDSIWVLKPV